MCGQHLSSQHLCGCRMLAQAMQSNIVTQCLRLIKAFDSARRDRVCHKLTAQNAPVVALSDIGVNPSSKNAATDDESKETNASKRHRGIKI